MKRHRGSREPTAQLTGLPPSSSIAGKEYRLVSDQLIVKRMNRQAARHVL